MVYGLIPKYKAQQKACNVLDFIEDESIHHCVIQNHDILISQLMYECELNFLL